MQRVKYNPAPITEVYTVEVFNKTGHGVATLSHPQGLRIDERKAICQEIADQIPDGYTCTVYTGVHSIGRTTPRNRTIQWGS